ARPFQQLRAALWPAPTPSGMQRRGARQVGLLLYTYRILHWQHYQGGRGVTDIGHAGIQQGLDRWAFRQLRRVQDQGLFQQRTFALAGLILEHMSRSLEL